MEQKTIWKIHESFTTEFVDNRQRIGRQLTASGLFGRDWPAAE
jgi:hypothetical protein